jgi:glycosyltransferase involved in cell wall biosynthesis
MSTLKEDGASYPAGVEVMHFPSPNPDEPENYVFLQQYVDDNRIDVVINQIGTDRPFCRLFTSPKGCNVISVVHNDPWDLLLCYYYFYFESWKRRLLAPLAPLMKYRNKRRLQRHYRLLVEESDVVVLLADFYKSRFGCFLSDKVVSIPNSAPAPLEAPINRKKQVIFVGRLYSAQKAPEYLIKAWSKIYSSFPDWELLLLGDGPDRASIEHLIERKGGAERLNIKMLGFVESTSYFRSASILGLTSRFEGWPMVLLEAMSMGCVPVSFENPVTRCIIDDNVNGKVVDLFDVDSFASALADLMTNREKLAKLSEMAIQKSQQFCMDRVAGEWYSLFNRLK